MFPVNCVFGRGVEMERDGFECKDFLVFQSEPKFAQIVPNFNLKISNVNLKKLLIFVSVAVKLITFCFDKLFWISGQIYGRLILAQTT